MAATADHTWLEIMTEQETSSLTTYWSEPLDDFNDQVGRPRAMGV